MKKTFRKFVSILTLIVFLMPQYIVQAEENQTNTKIVASPSATLHQMEKWAKNAGATDTFVGLAQMYWSLAPSYGGVDPVVAYAQAAKETNYGRFGGVLDESFHNPCGLKTKTGGNNDDPNAHQRFDSWEQGIKAHLDHLALYAGSAGYPKQSGQTYDPRHFPELFNTANNSVEGLGGKWAPSSTYGTELVSMVNSIKSTGPKESMNTLVNLDYPNKNSLGENEDLQVAGWALGEDGVTSVKASLNSNSSKNATLGVKRTDVGLAYPNYINSTNSGFETVFKASEIPFGTNTLTIEAIDKTGQSMKVTKTIEKIELVPRVYIDSVLDGQSINQGDSSTLSIDGWAVNKSGIKNIRVFLNDYYLGDATYGISKPDVNSTFPGYPSKNNPAFKYMLDINKCNQGINTVKITAVGNDGSSKDIVKTINVTKNTQAMHIDYPAYSSLANNGKVTIEGWAVNKSGVQAVKVYVNNKFIANAQYGLLRKDVGSIFPSYKDSDYSGYSLSLDTSSYKSDDYQITVEVLGKDNQITRLTNKLSLYDPVPRSYLDDISGNLAKTLNVSGWALNKSGIKEVQVLVDGLMLGKANIGKIRNDVNAAYPGYLGGKESGYTGSFSTENIVQGHHTLTVRAVGNDGSIKDIVRDIAIEKQAARLWIDSPSQDSSIEGIINVSGWALEAEGVKEVKVYLDDNYVGSATYGSTRKDVSNIYSGYVDGYNNGFKFTLLPNKVTPGNHKMKVSAIANDGEIITKSNDFTVVKKEPHMNIDYPNSNNIMNIKDLTISGWAINAEGIDRVEVYLDKVLTGTANIGLERKDVGAIYSKYTESNNSGFNYKLSANLLKEGKHELKIVAYGKDGSKQETVNNVNFFNNDTRIWVDSPGGIVSGANLDVNGWALSYNGVTAVKLYIDNSFVTKADYGFKRSDVGNLYPGYSCGSNCGFKTSINSSNLSNGTHTLTIELIDSNGVSKKIDKTFVYYKLDPIISVDSSFNSGDRMPLGSKLNFGGWALNQTGLKSVQYSIDNVVKGSLTSFSQRDDVVSLYPKYGANSNLGFNFSVDTNGLAKGDHKIDITAIGNDGQAITKSYSFTLYAKLIVVDPGHNYGGDDGAYSPDHTYSERELNMQVAVKLQSALTDMGYTVAMTRQPWEKPVDDLTTSLKKRYTYANDLNADLFISLHHDSGTTSSTGMSTFYSTYKPGLKNIQSDLIPLTSGYDGYADTKPTDASVKSRTFAKNVEEALTSRCNYRKIGYIDRNLSVTVNTNMPSVLIELGFISNLNEAARCSNQNEQQNKANVIADEVRKMF